MVRLDMEAELNWPDDKEKDDLLDVDNESVTELTTDAGDGEIEIKIDDTLLDEKRTTTITTTKTTASAGTSLTMDDYFFTHFVRSCKNVSEATSYLEIFNYSVRGRWCHSTHCS